MQRLNMALQELKAGRSTTDVAFDSGYESLSGFGYTCKKLTGFAPSAQRQVVLIHRFTTPLGPMFVCATQRGICLLEFVDRRALESDSATCSGGSTPASSQVKMPTPGRRNRK